MSKARDKYVHNLKRDFAIIIASILLALVLVQIGIIDSLVSYTKEASIFGSFLAGIFFTSAFTLAPSSIAIAKISSTVPAVTVALWGALGAMIGDLIIFLFIRDAFAQDLAGYFKTSKYKKLLRFFHLGIFKVLSPFIGALIIASPLPDEFGLALMGLSKVKTIYLIPIAFVMNYLGIMGIIALARIF